ncbi:hypothetical protein EAI_06694 [Harpegnathos saltator]|uniref:Uncharacterized protein n=1 Tax=Harpegnathos saltator TaxID=610380 RepID=E2C649_HARSA|nr:hypothetical protein EAI_06694 [Harpegnathos saltator]
MYWGLMQTHLYLCCSSTTDLAAVMPFVLPRLNSDRVREYGLSLSVDCCRWSASATTCRYIEDEGQPYSDGLRNRHYAIRVKYYQPAADHGVMPADDTGGATARPRGELANAPA